MKNQRTWRLFSGLAVVLFSGAVSHAAPGTVRPWDDSEMPDNAVRGSTASVGHDNVAAIPGMQGSADHIVSQQCPNGGFGWPHGPSCGTTYNNITAPICLGLLDAYLFTGDVAHLNAAIAGGNYDLTFQFANLEFRFSAMTPYFLWRLGGAFSTHAETEFFDELDAGTYGPTDLNTAGWIAYVQTGRSGSSINLRPWEFHTLISTAAAIGNAGQDAAFRQGLLDGLNTLDNTNPGGVYWDMLGLAGGVRGLAMSGTTVFPAIVSPNHAGINGISTLKDLADKLASYQNGNGSWYWSSNLVGPLAWDEDTQTTAYASLALVAADNALGTSDYLAANLSSSNWLYTMRLPSGGFLDYPGAATENTEVEGEAVSAINIKSPEIPAVSEWGLLVLVLIGLSAGTVIFGRRPIAAH